MTIDQILTLSAQGWSRDEILRMSNMQPQTQTQPQTQPQTQTQTQPQTQTQTQPQTQPDPQQIPGMDALTAKLDSLITGLQSSALINAQQPKPRTPEDILAEIINPPTM